MQQNQRLRTFSGRQCECPWLFKGFR